MSITGIEFTTVVYGPSDLTITFIYSEGGGDYSAAVTDADITVTLGTTASVPNLSFADLATTWNADGTVNGLATAFSDDTSQQLLTAGVENVFPPMGRGSGLGQYYWELLTIARPKATPQYIKRFNAPGH